MFAVVTTCLWLLLHVCGCHYMVVVVVTCLWLFLHVCATFVCFDGTCNEFCGCLLLALYSIVHLYAFPLNVLLPDMEIIPFRLLFP